MSNIIVFDGVCVLCAAWLRFVLKHDRKEMFRFSTMQSPAGRKLMVMHDLDPDDPATLLVLTDKDAHTDSDAMLQVIAGFGGTWRLVAILRIVPPLIRDLLYRFVGRHRYRLFGKRQSCIIPDAKTRDRFVLQVADLNLADNS